MSDLALWEHIAVMCFLLTPILMIAHLINVIIFGASPIAWTAFPPLITLQGMMIGGQSSG